MTSNLNKEQLEAVKHVDGALLILAGAGTGKTSTITHRLSYLIELGIDPASILVLTFTNKASKEMRDRSFAMLDGNLSSYPLLCTFHKFGLLFLQFYIHKLGRENNFIVIDKSDKKKLLRNIDNSLPPSYVQSSISLCKNMGLLANEVDAGHIKDIRNFEKIASIYKTYEKALIDDNLLDFDDLILLPNLILNQFKDVKDEVNKKYDYVMIDEFQDTNSLQLSLIKNICSNNNICVVGDDDQSIYSWRGADIKNILNFHEHFKDVKKITLTKNYRSSEEILSFAHDIISVNENRYPKKLQSTLGSMNEVNTIYSANEHEEGLKIANLINDFRLSGESISNIAILFRVHAISRSIEDYLYRFNIPYKVIGGIKFYERAEIKDIIAYLRVIELEDDFSIKRVINVPKRGIGKKTLEKIDYEARKQNIKIFEYIDKVEEDNLKNIVGAKNTKTIKEFVYSIKFLQKIKKEGIKNLSYEIESTIKIRNYYEAMQDSIDRLANIDEFYAYFNEYVEDSNQDLSTFLNDITLQSDQDQIENEELCLMSIHASKGLEFDNVMVVGLENGVFPIIAEDVDMEEERRLAYVASTRAKKNLFLFSSRSRLYKGRDNQLETSLFLSKKPTIIKYSNDDFFIGDVVSHKVFGFGKILSMNKKIDKLLLSIKFANHQKDILSNYIQKV